MKLAIGCDHGGFAMKEDLIAYLREKGHEVLDMGTYSTDSCHYPTYAQAVCEEVLAGRAEKGILICGTGIGMSMAANKVRGIRAALCSDPYSAEMTRRHNDANVMTMGARVIGIELAYRIVDAFLGHDFEGGRHATRVDMVMALEEK